MVLCPAFSEGTMRAEMAEGGIQHRDARCARRAGNKRPGGDRKHGLDPRVGLSFCCISVLGCDVLVD